VWVVRVVEDMLNLNGMVYWVALLVYLHKEIMVAVVQRIQLIKLLLVEVAALVVMVVMVYMIILGLEVLEVQHLHQQSLVHL
jgi:hypothetical protein